jgi:ketosteroid isomerase-like protein
MAMTSGDVAEALRMINNCWLERRPRDLAPLLHPEIVLVIPGFAGRISGRDALIEGFVDFCENARVVSFKESDLQVDQFADTAVVSFAFDMVYEREGSRYHSTGRDFWVFTRQDGSWLACWRSMLDVREEPA